MRFFALKSSDLFEFYPEIKLSKMNEKIIFENNALKTGQK